MLETRYLDVSSADVAVCRGLDRTIAAGRYRAVLGRNGVGKPPCCIPSRDFGSPCRAKAACRISPWRDSPGGERERLAIASLLTQDPALGLLDEPTNHLDLNYQVAVLELLRNMCARGQAMLMILHDVNLALRLCNHLLLLLGDGKYRQGATGSLGSAENLSQVYQQSLTQISGPRGPVMVPG